MNDYYWERLIRSIEDLNGNISRLSDGIVSIDKKINNLSADLELSESIKSIIRVNTNLNNTCSIFADQFEVVEEILKEFESRISALEKEDENEIEE